MPFAGGALRIATGQDHFSNALNTLNNGVAERSAQRNIRNIQAVQHIKLSKRKLGASSYAQNNVKGVVVKDKTEFYQNT